MQLSVRFLILTVMLFGGVVLAQDGAPPEVKLTPAAGPVNQQAEQLLRTAFSNILAADADSLFSGPIICGPYLWEVLRSEPETAALSPSFNPFALPLKQGEQLIGYRIMLGRILRTPRDNGIFRALLNRRARLKPGFIVRRLQPAELSHLWSMVAWNLSEPLFALDDGSAILIVNLAQDGERMPMFWIDDFSSSALNRKIGKFYATTDPAAAIKDFMKINDLPWPAGTPADGAGTPSAVSTSGPS